MVCTPVGKGFQQGAFSLARGGGGGLNSSMEKKRKSQGKKKNRTIQDMRRRERRGKGGGEKTDFSISAASRRKKKGEKTWSGLPLRAWGGKKAGTSNEPQEKKKGAGRRGEKKHLLDTSCMSMIKGQGTPPSAAWEGKEGEKQEDGRSTPIQ